MGWTGGTIVATNLILSKCIQKQDDETRRTLFLEIIDTLENADWDGLCECTGMDPVLDKIIQERYPEWFDEYCR